MTLINQSKKIHVQHEIGDWDKEKYFEVSKAVSDLKSQKTNLIFKVKKE